MRPLGRYLAVLGTAAVLGLWTQSGWALEQPDGTPIPQGNGLQGLFDGRGEAINALASASTTPETFVPGCNLTFHVLQRNAGYRNSFGWYNVTGSAPQPSDLHEFLSCSDDVGTERVLAIRSDPAYTGGEVGFYEATGACGTPTDHLALFFSEKKYNPDGSESNPYIHLLIYNSTATPRAFYFGWEDLLSGGDNDFDDLTTFVTGITCSGGGGPCSTGQPGICADGTLQCQGGTLSCVQNVQPGTEKCDGLDNDCNGHVDDGELCEANEVCDQGTCVPRCGTGEFTCSGNLVCSAKGVCVEPDCATVQCPEGERCIHGTCTAPCDNVVCPHGQVCRVGQCVDPCQAVTCDSEQICVEGVCLDRCQCTSCPASKTCQSSGQCVDDACLTVSCPPGNYCAPDGSCHDLCEGVSCPGGGACVDGQCTDTPADAGTDSGSGGSGGGVLFEAGTDSSAEASTRDSGDDSGGWSGSGGDWGAPPPQDGDDGCGCRLAPSPAPKGLVLTLLTLGLAALLRRPRRRSF